MRVSRWLAKRVLASFALLVNCAAVQAQSTSFSLSAAASPSQEVTLAVRAPARIPVTITRSGPAPAGPVALDVEPFTNDAGDSIAVPISLGADASSPATHLEAKFDRALTVVNLHIPELSAAGKYTGRLLLTVPQQAPGQAQVIVWRFNLSSADALRPATVVLDQNAVVLTSVRPWCPLGPHLCLGRSEDPVVTLHVRDKTGNAPIIGVVARLESGFKSPDPKFDLSKNMSASFDAVAVDDIFRSPAPGLRDVRERGQATISLKFHDLAAGEYAVPLRFSAANSGADDLQRVTVTLQVREHVAGAIGVLVIAALVSLVATRVVSMLRQRASLLARVHALRPYWLGQEMPTVGVIWLKATLRLVEDLSKRRWLTGQNELEARLVAAASMLAALEAIRQVRMGIRGIVDSTMRNRAFWRLDRIADAIEPSSLTEKDVACLRQELGQLSAWYDTDAARCEAAYWADLAPAIRTRCAQVEIAAIPAAGQTLAQTLLDRLNQSMQAQPTLRQDMIAAEENYQRLSILWELRGQQTLIEHLVGLHPAGGVWAGMERVFEVVDNFHWAHLNRKDQPLQVEGPQVSTIDPSEAYEPLTFTFKAADQALLKSYLLQKKLTYTWTIEVRARKRWWWPWNGSPRTLRVESTEPQVAQYSPVAGTLQASVSLAYKGQSGRDATQSEPTPINQSGDFGVWRAFAAADAIGFGVVLVMSIVSGVALYALAPTFGSLKEYLALFTWGAGLDQGKNFLQSLAAYSAVSGKPDKGQS